MSISPAGTSGNGNRSAMTRSSSSMPSPVTELSETTGSAVVISASGSAISRFERTTMPFGAASACAMTSRSSSVISPLPSTTAMTSSALLIAARLRSTPRRSTSSSVSRMPAVSIRRSVRRPMRSFSSIVSRVVPGIAVTIARS